jgi:hypothetical protein
MLGLRLCSRFRRSNVLADSRSRERTLAVALCLIPPRLALCDLVVSHLALRQQTLVFDANVKRLS